NFLPIMKIYFFPKIFLSYHHAARAVNTFWQNQQYHNNSFRILSIFIFPLFHEKKQGRPAPPKASSF
ncbi:MAG: hypothetical protein ACLR29_01855, partial [Faecalibacterium prausnitzii]